MKFGVINRFSSRNENIHSHKLFEYMNEVAERKNADLFSLKMSFDQLLSM